MYVSRAFVTFLASFVRTTIAALLFVSSYAFAIADKGINMGLVHLECTQENIRKFRWLVLVVFSVLTLASGS